MVIRFTRFNTYLLGFAALTLLAGCETTSSKRDKQVAMIRLHMEAGRDAQDRTLPVTVPRSGQLTLNVNRDPFLNESHVKQATVVDTLGGICIVLQFDQRGTWLLEQYSATNPGRHIVIGAQFGEKLEVSRWLGAPVIYRRISDGSISFTPDATREEAEEIVKGLNTVAIKSGNQPKPKKEKDKAKDK